MDNSSDKSISESRENFKLIQSFHFFVGSAWRDTGLDPFEFTVLANLVSRMDQHNNCYPSIDTIADECRISRAKIFGVLKGLREKGFLAWHKRDNATNLYLIIGHPKMPGVQEVDPWGPPRRPPPVHHIDPKVNPSEGEPKEGKEEEGAAPPFDPPLTFSSPEEKSLKKEKVDGTRTGVVGAQRPLSGVEAALEAEAVLSQRPKGMPPLSAIETELARKGFPVSDALDIFGLWLSNGFTHGGQPIKDWKATLQRRILNGWLKSQKENSVAPNFTPPSEAEVLAYAKAKKYSNAYGRWCYQWFVGRNWKYFKDAITTTAQWQALMDTELFDRAPK